jgi:hypothetical protein
MCGGPGPPASVHGSIRFIKLWPSKLGSTTLIISCEGVCCDLFSATRETIYGGD